MPEPNQHHSFHLPNSLSIDELKEIGNVRIYLAGVLSISAKMRKYIQAHVPGVLASVSTTPPEYHALLRWIARHCAKRKRKRTNVA